MKKMILVMLPFLVVMSDAVECNIDGGRTEFLQCLKTKQMENMKLTQDLNKQLIKLSHKFKNKIKKIKVGSCQYFNGNCGKGTYNKPTFYLDRVGYSCPSTHPIMSGIRFVRCGKINTKEEGLKIKGKCCKINNE